MNIPRFMPGQQLTAAHLNQLSDAIRTSRVTSFVGGRIQLTTGGTMLIADQPPSSGGSAAVETDFPFKVQYLRTESNRPIFQTYEESYLIKDQTDKNLVSISPINVEGAFAEYFLPSAPGVICVTVDFDANMDINNAYQEQIGVSAWDNYPNPVERDLEASGVDYLRQKRLRIPIAEVAPDTDKRPGTVYDDNGTAKKLIQIASTNFVLSWQVLEGMAALLAMPFPRGHCWLHA